MNQVEFCYWLQGYFELRAPGARDPGPPLVTSQLAVVRRHLALVKKAEGRRLSGFCAWLDFVLEEIAADGGVMTDARHARIVRRLSDAFEHDIDPTYEGDQDGLNDAHGPGTVYRC